MQEMQEMLDWSLDQKDPLSEGGLGNSLQYSCPGNPMDRGAWQAAVHGVTQSWRRLSSWAHTLWAGPDLPLRRLAHCWDTGKGNRRGDVRSKETGAEYMEKFPKIIPRGTEETVASAVWTRRRRLSKEVPLCPHSLHSLVSSQQDWQWASRLMARGLWSALVIWANYPCLVT